MCPSRLRDAAKHNAPSTDAHRTRDINDEGRSDEVNLSGSADTRIELSDVGAIWRAIGGAMPGGSNERALERIHHVWKELLHNHCGQPESTLELPYSFVWIGVVTSILCELKLSSSLRLLSEALENHIFVLARGCMCA